MIGVVVILLVFLPLLGGLVLAMTTGTLDDEATGDDLEPSGFGVTADIGRAAWKRRRDREEG